MEKRAHPRTIIDRYYSVEFDISGTENAYQFKIWDISEKGLCILVKEGSELIQHLKVGTRLNMKYYKIDSSNTADYIKTEIRHITKDENGRFRGHYLVGLYIIEGQDVPSEK